MPHPIYDMNSDYYIAPYTDDDGHETLESSSIRAEAMDRYDYDVRTEDIRYLNQRTVTAEQLTNYADEPITCIECNMQCTRPTAKTIRTKICKRCRNKIQKKEELNISPIEKGIELMEDKKETIIVNKAEPKKGILQKMRIQRTAEGIQLIYESPIMQNFFKAWFYSDNHPEQDSNISWRSNIFPEGYEHRAYFQLKELQKQYSTLLYFQWADTKLVYNGKPNLAFLQAVNDFPLKENGEPLGKTEAANKFKMDKKQEFMNPNKPIVLTLKGLYPNKVLDDFMMRTKEVMYQIYADNLMPFDKSVIISMESKNETTNH